MAELSLSNLKPQNEKVKLLIPKQKILDNGSVPDDHFSCNSTYRRLPMPVCVLVCQLPSEYTFARPVALHHELAATPLTFTTFTLKTPHHRTNTLLK